jgi:hypothetical protein
MSQDETIDRNRLYLALAGTLVLAFLLRLYRLGAQGFWIDEIFSYVATHPHEPYTFIDYVKNDLHGVLYHTVVYAWSFLGDSEAWLRLPSVVAGTLAVYLTYRLGRSLYDPRLGVMAAFALALNPIHIYYSQELRNYSFLLVFVLLSFLGYVAAVRTARYRSFTGHGLATGGGILCNFSSLFALAAQALTALFTGKLLRRKWIGGWAVSLLLILLLGGFWGLRQARLLKWERLDDVETAPVEEKLRGETTFTPWAFPYTFYVFSVGNYVGPSLEELHQDPHPSTVFRHAATVVPVILVFGILVVAGLVELWRRGKHRTLLLLGIVVPLLFTAFIARQNVKVFNPRYALVGLPLYVLVLALGLERLRGKLRVGTGFLALAATLFALGNYYFNPRYGREDVRGAAELVQWLSEPEDVIVVPTVTEVFQHYFDGTNEVVNLRAGVSADTTGTEEALAKQVGETDGVWYVRARPWVNDSGGWISEALETRLDEVSRHELPGVTVIRYARLIRRDLQYEIRQSRDAGAQPMEVFITDDPTQEPGGG